VNPVEYRLEPIIIDNDNFMKARIRQERDFVNNRILNGMANDNNFLLMLLQNMNIYKEEDYMRGCQVFIPHIFVVPAAQVIAERQRTMAPQYNGERIVNRTGSNRKWWGGI
jgi:hypothetical protein